MSKIIIQLNPEKHSPQYWLIIILALLAITNMGFIISQYQQQQTLEQLEQTNAQLYVTWQKHMQNLKPQHSTLAKNVTIKPIKLPWSALLSQQVSYPKQDILLKQLSIQQKQAAYQLKVTGYGSDVYAIEAYQLWLNQQPFIKHAELIRINQIPHKKWAQEFEINAELSS